MLNSHKRLYTVTKPCTIRSAHKNCMPEEKLFICNLFSIGISRLHYIVLIFLHFPPPHVSTAPSGPGFSSLYRFYDHSQLHTPWLHSSRRVISPLQTPLPDNTQHSQETDIHTVWQYSNSQSQKASSRKPMPQTMRPLGSAWYDDFA